MTDWQKQNFKKTGSSAPSSMHSKIGTGSSTLHSKIAQCSVRKYADGGMVQDDFTGVDEAVAKQAAETSNSNPYQGDDTDPFSGARNDDGSINKSEPEPVAKKQTFKEAFAENRKAGNATFEYEGKKFTTELAKPKAAPRNEKKTDSSASVVRKPTQSAPVPKVMTFTDTGSYDDGAKLSLATGGTFGSKANTAARPVVQRGRGVIDTSNIDSNTLLPKR